jgi:hypothetical protein
MCNFGTKRNKYSPFLRTAMNHHMQRSASASASEPALDSDEPSLSAQRSGSATPAPAERAQKNIFLMRSSYIIDYLR